MGDEQHNTLLAIWFGGFRLCSLFTWQLVLFDHTTYHDTIPSMVLFYHNVIIYFLEEAMRFKLLTAIVLTVVLVAMNSMAANKVVVIPLNSSVKDETKLWGEGRVGTGMSSEDTVNGIKIARSYATASWDGAAAACPKNTWVCTFEEIENMATDYLTSFSKGLRCDGTEYTSCYSWVQDEYKLDRTKGIAPCVVDFFGYVFMPFYQQKCEHLRVWCCSVAN